MGLFGKNINELTDEALMVRLIKRNDHEALTELYRRYSRKLLGYFIRMFKGDQAKSEDFLQDLFIKIMDKKHLFDPDKKFYTWVFTMASNMCKTEFRKPVTHSISDQHLKDEDHIVFSDSEMDRQQFKQVLRQCIHQLDYHHKVVFILRFNEQFALSEIADIMEVSVGTVKSRLFYATKKVTKAMKAYNPNNETNFFKIK